MERTLDIDDLLLAYREPLVPLFNMTLAEKTGRLEAVTIPKLVGAMFSPYYLDRTLNADVTYMLPVSCETIKQKYYSVFQCSFLLFFLFGCLTIWNLNLSGPHLMIPISPPLLLSASHLSSSQIYDWISTSKNRNNSFFLLNGQFCNFLSFFSSSSLSS